MGPHPFNEVIAPVLIIEHLYKLVNLLGLRLRIMK